MFNIFFFFFSYSKRHLTFISPLNSIYFHNFALIPQKLGYFFFFELRKLFIYKYNPFVQKEQKNFFFLTKVYQCPQLLRFLTTSKKKKKNLLGYIDIED
jgi:hypothetical protein